MLVAIDPAQLNSFATVTIGNDPENPLYEGDTLEAVFVVAEGFQPDGTPVDPAPFGTDSGGWGAEVIMATGDTLAATVDTPLTDDGQIVLRLALDESLAKAGKHRGKVRIFNPIGARTQQRTVFDFIMPITQAPDTTP